MTVPLYKSLFDIEYLLCKEFRALSPFEVEDMSFITVVELFADTRDMQIRSEAQEGPASSGNKYGNYAEPRKKDNRVIRRPAGDSWF